MSDRALQVQNINATQRSPAVVTIPDAPLKPRPPERRAAGHHRRGRAVVARSSENVPPTRKPRILVVPASAQAHPRRPVCSPKNAPLAFRERKLLAAPMASSVGVLVEKPKALVSSPSLDALVDQKRVCAPRSLPPSAIQRARSAPSLMPRTGCTSNLNDLRLDALGASLRCSSVLMLDGIPSLAWASQARRTALPVAVRAAKTYFDPSTGRSTALRF